MIWNEIVELNLTISQMMTKKFPFCILKGNCLLCSASSPSTSPGEIEYSLGHISWLGNRSLPPSSQIPSASPVQPCLNASAALSHIFEFLRWLVVYNLAVCLVFSRTLKSGTHLPFPEFLGWILHSHCNRSEARMGSGLPACGRAPSTLPYPRSGPWDCWWWCAPCLSQGNCPHSKVIAQPHPFHQHIILPQILYFLPPLYYQPASQQKP